MSRRHPIAAGRGKLFDTSIDPIRARRMESELENVEQGTAQRVEEIKAEAGFPRKTEINDREHVGERSEAKIAELDHQPLERPVALQGYDPVQLESVNQVKHDHDGNQNRRSGVAHSVSHPAHRKFTNRQTRIPC